MKTSYFLWAIYLLIYPFYLFEEGNPQLADIFGTLLILINAKTILLNIRTNPINHYLFIFVIYTAIINTVLMISIGDITVLKNSLYYTYSFLLMITVFSKLKETTFLKTTLISASASVIIQLILFPFITYQGVRTQLFFNNPNQLALWGICMLIIIFLTTKRLKIKPKIYIPLLIGITITILISASRAALVGAILFWIYFISKSLKNILIITTILVSTFIFLDKKLDLEAKSFAFIEYNFNRFSNNTLTGNQSINNRGFNRISENPQYLLFGAGEGANIERFNEKIELHSTFLNILFSYGFIGLIIYLLAFSSLLKKISTETIILFLCIVFFASMHMTLRIPLFWITLLFIVFFKTEKITLEKTF